MAMKNSSADKAQGMGRTISRRGFLQAEAAGAAALAAGAALTQTAGAAEEEQAKPADEREYEVINCDLLVIGSGMGGMAAAFKGLELGMNVVLVDKGPYISSGATGMNFDICASWYQTPMGFTRNEWPVTLANDEIFLGTAGNPMIEHMDDWWMNHGSTFTYRDEDGANGVLAMIPDWVKFNEHAYARFPKNDLARNQNISIYERTFLTDLIVQDGKCLGAMGIYLPTGGFRVFRAKATVMTAGGCGWMYGWNTCAPYSPQVPDNTADLEMAAWRHGAGVSEAEFTDYDMMSVYPSGVSCGYAGGVGTDSRNIDFHYNAKGERFYNDQGYYDCDLMADRALYARLYAKEVAEGRGSSIGGIYVDYSSEEARDLASYMFMRNIDMIKEVFDIDLTQGMVEIVAELEEHGGAPVVDGKLMSVDFEGLFCHRGAGVGGEATPTGTNRTATYGDYAGACAVEYIKAHEGDPVEVDWSVVDAEYDRLTGIRESSSENGIRPVQIRRAIQKVGYDCLGVWRDPEVLKAGVAELARIRKEDLPKQFVVDHSLAYNCEWKEAIENYNLLAITEMSVNASLLREESRGGYFRPDFPEVDHENWDCMLVCYCGEDGDLVFEKQPVNDIDWSTVDLSSIL